MPNSSEDRFVALMLSFASLSAAQQERFLDAMNLYLFASPQRRRQYVRTWTSRLQSRHPEPGEQGEGIC